VAFLLFNKSTRFSNI